MPTQQSGQLLPRRILIAADKFKLTLPAQEVTEAMARGLLSAQPHWQVQQFPLADGGEGTSEILTRHAGGRLVEVTVHDPLMRPVTACFGISGDERTAFAEMSQASGLWRLTAAERNPLKTNTFGTGELILQAARTGATTLVLGIGGSATNDAGIGMAAALGYRFLDVEGSVLLPIGENLARIARIDDSQNIFRKEKPPRMLVLCDVDNPLYGPRGAARTFAGQKGADATTIELLDTGLRSFGRLLEDYTGRPLVNLPGAGAAGGLGVALMAFFGAELRPGIENILDLTGFERALADADLVITGEGRLDAQTLGGKVIGGVCAHALAAGKPVVALCGAVELAPADLQRLGLAAAFCIAPGPRTLDEALAATAADLERTAYQIGKLLAVFG
jgi:glycerate kinase